ncbi:MAG TPA: hypothetical protein VIO32_02715 [Candidatus Baltobacteraceae bacterium]
MLYEASYTGSYYTSGGCIAKSGCIRYVRGFAVLIEQSTNSGNTWTVTDGCTSAGSPLSSPVQDLCPYSATPYAASATFTIPASFFANGTPDVIVYEDTYTAPSTLQIYTSGCGPMHVSPSSFMAAPAPPSWTNRRACVNV